MAASVIFEGQVLSRVLRVVDFGAGNLPRLAVETQEPPDALGGMGWSGVQSIDVPTLAALLLAAGIIH